MLDGCASWPEEFVRRYVEAGYWEDRTLGEMLDEAAEKFGPREAVVGDDGTRYTYQELRRLSDRLALHFLDLGLKPK
ncbi:MAG: (2,3-dihydroxybenzoyl)adenylate synthase, partial [Dehalococcoidia bacterium]|nr:(2,3-dihydroxybenzoyl)adenylate synthase [Dehalococcoidia bacterium]